MRCMYGFISGPVGNIYASLALFTTCILLMFCRDALM